VLSRDIVSLGGEGVQLAITFIELTNNIHLAMYLIVFIYE
jgi:hypothetical protein